MPTQIEPRVQLRSNKEIAIHVRDLDRAEAFYGKLLGFILVRRTLDQLEFDLVFDIIERPAKIIA